MRNNNRSKNRIIVLSDIHMGTDFPTVWYNKNFHEPYLIRTLDYIIQNASTIKEVVLLGDIFDFWLYPPDMTPPTFDQIINTHPNILGPKGKLSDVLNELQGNVIFIPGNHDMNITQKDLDKINPNGPKIKLGPEIYQPDKRIIFTHGHKFTMFNAPYTENKDSIIKPLPIGYLGSRAYAFELNAILKGKTVADLPNQGYPDITTSSYIGLGWQSLQPGESVASVFLSSLNLSTGMSKYYPVKFPNGTSVTLDEAQYIYRDLWNSWSNKFGGGILGNLVATKSAYADKDGTYMAWFAQKLALEEGGYLVVMGHTHTPKLGLTDGMVDYVNNGFMCPSKPDMLPSAGASRKYITFTEINIDNFEAKLWSVEFENGVYNIKEFKAPKDSVVKKPGTDYSCYITIINTTGSTMKIKGNPVANNGYYVVSPPTEIPSPSTARFWIQDLEGPKGSDGEVTYDRQTKPITFTYKCPTLTSNSCSPPFFATKSDGDKSYVYNKIVEKGHPFFVRFAPYSDRIAYLEYEHSGLVVEDDYIRFLRNMFKLYECTKSNTCE